MVWVYGGGTHYSSFLFQEIFVYKFSEIFGMVSSWFGGINLASLILPYPAIFDKLPKILLDHFSLIHFSVFINFGELFFNFIVCIFGTVTGCILIVGGSLPEIELLSLIVIECILSSFQ